MPFLCTLRARSFEECQPQVLRLCGRWPASRWSPWYVNSPKVGGNYPNGGRRLRLCATRTAGQITPPSAHMPHSRLRVYGQVPGPTILDSHNYCFPWAKWDAGEVYTKNSCYRPCLLWLPNSMVYTAFREKKPSPQKFPQVLQWGRVANPGLFPKGQD